MKIWMYILFLMVIAIAFIIGCGEKLTEEQMRARATSHESKEQWEEAVKYYEDLVKSFPNSEKANEDLYRLGMLYGSQLKDFEKSVGSYKKLIEKYPESRHVIQSLFMIGYRYANDIKDMEKARQVYQEFLKKYPTHELASSVEWELNHLGEDISSIEVQLGKQDTVN